MTTTEQMQQQVQGQPMRQIRIEKVTVNMGVGQAGDELKKAATILQKITNMKPVECLCKVKQPTWGIREGLPIGVKVTLRGQGAEEFLKKAFYAKENHLKESNFDLQGNFGFGIKEYIELPGTKYDPTVGIRGFDVLVTLSRPGYRIKRRKLLKRSVPKTHALKKEEAIEFIRKKFGVEVA